LRDGRPGINALRLQLSRSESSQIFRWSPDTLRSAGYTQSIDEGSFFVGGKQLHLNAFLMSTGHHEASWRLPESDPFAATDVAHYVKLATTAERGTFDSLFLAAWPVGAFDPADRAGWCDRADRADRDGVDVIQLAV
jgi:hypothetical protein